MDHVNILRIKGADIQKYMDECTTMRFNAFKEFPYLYHGSIEFEKEYLSSYITNDDALFLIALDNNQVVAMITGIPLDQNNAVFEKLSNELKKRGVNPSDYYYLGDGIILPPYRKPEFSYGLYKEFIAEVKKMGYPKLGVITAMREKNHPQQPKKYRSIESFLKYIKFTRTDIVLPIAWPTILEDGQVEMRENNVQFWEKAI